MSRPKRSRSKGRPCEGGGFISKQLGRNGEGMTYPSPEAAKRIRRLTGGNRTTHIDSKHAF